MRVALVGPYPLDPRALEGGVETSFMTLVSALSRLPNLEPHVISFAVGLDAPRRAVVDGVPIDYLPRIRRVGSLTFHLRERRALARVLRSLGPDVVHAHDSTRYGYVCLKAVDDAPVIVMIHGIAREELRFERRLHDRARVVIAGTRLERYCIAHARYLLQPTRYPEEYFGAEIRGRIWAVDVPISDRFFAEAQPERGRMLYVGAVIPRKRLLDLVEALPAISAAVPEARLHVVGGGVESEYGVVIRARARELAVDDRIVFLGPVAPTEIVEEYRCASVVVLPSAQETSPVVIGEAMAGGVPVVATNVGGVQYLVDEDRTGHLIAPGDVPTLAERVVGLLGDPARAARLGAAGRVKADRHYRLPVVAARVADIYRDVVRLEHGSNSDLERATEANKA